MFKNSDLLYIFISMVDVANRVSENTSEIYLGLFKANKIFLSTEGFVKLYPFKINQNATMSQINFA